MSKWGNFWREVRRASQGTTWNMMEMLVERSYQTAELAVAQLADEEKRHEETENRLAELCREVDRVVKRIDQNMMLIHDAGALALMQMHRDNLSNALGRASQP